MKSVKYSHITKLGDIARINREIREDISKLRRPNSIMKRVLQSRYLYTLMHSKRMQNHLRKEGINIHKAKQSAKRQYCLTASIANKRLSQLGYEKIFSEMCLA
jgi:hypothetical protein